MRVVFLVEDRFDGETCCILGRKLRDDIHFSFQPTKGKGEMIRRGDFFIEQIFNPKRTSKHKKQPQGADFVIVVVDRDRPGEPSKRLIERIKKHCNPYDPYAILVLAIEEIEAWFLADVPALTAYLKLPENTIKVYGDTQSISDPKKEITRLFKDKTKAKKRTYSVAEAPQIARQIDPTRARLHNASFDNFCTTIHGLTP